MIGPTSTPIPTTVIIDPVSGYAVNVPVSEQDYPFWWIDHPETYARIKQIRKHLGIVVVDFPDGVSQPSTEKVTVVRMKTLEELDAQK